MFPTQHNADILIDIIINLLLVKPKQKKGFEPTKDFKNFVSL